MTSDAKDCLFAGFVIGFFAALSLHDKSAAKKKLDGDLTEVREALANLKGGAK
jgi:hypothetical protein